MTNLNETAQPAPETLDETSLDLVVGGVIVHEVTGGDTTSARKQEQNDKVA